MQEKLKMTQQKDKNLAQVQQHYSVYFSIKIIFKSQFFWLIWPFKCLILMILTSTKYHGNLLKDSSWSLLSLVKFFTSLETKKILKIPNRTFLKITRYNVWDHASHKLMWSPYNRCIMTVEIQYPTVTVLKGLKFFFCYWWTSAIANI